MSRQTSFFWQITPGFWVAAALLIYLDEYTHLLLPITGACIFHEAGHLLAAWCLGLPVYGVKLSAMGAELLISRRCSYFREGILIGAGALVNLLLCLFSTRLPWENAHLFGAVNLLIALFNLLPIPPLDGGELSGVISTFFCPGRTGWALYRALSVTCCVMLSFWGIQYAMKGNPSLLILSVWLSSGIIHNET